MLKTELITLVLCASAACAQTLSISRASGAPGETVELPVTLSSASGAAAVQFDLDYDRAALDITPVAGEAARDAGKEVSFRRESGRVVVAGLNRTAIADGVLLKLRVAIRDSTAVEHPIRISAVAISDAAGASKRCATVDGLVTLERRPPNRLQPHPVRRSK